MKTLRESILDPEFMGPEVGVIALKHVFQEGHIDVGYSLPGELVPEEYKGSWWNHWWIDDNDSWPITKFFKKEVNKAINKYDLAYLNMDDPNEIIWKLLNPDCMILAPEWGPDANRPNSKTKYWHWAPKCVFGRMNKKELQATKDRIIDWFMSLLTPNGVDLINYLGGVGVIGVAFSESHMEKPYWAGRYYSVIDIVLKSRSDAWKFAQTLDVADHDRHFWGSTKNNGVSKDLVLIQITLNRWADKAKPLKKHIEYK